MDELREAGGVDVGVLEALVGLVEGGELRGGPCPDGVEGRGLVDAGAGAEDGEEQLLVPKILGITTFGSMPWRSSKAQMSFAKSKGVWKSPNSILAKVFISQSRDAIDTACLLNDTTVLQSPL